MEAAASNAGKRKLTQNLSKSLAKVRLSNSKKLTVIDKKNIKKAAVKTLQTYLKSELRKTTVKTYDWYFFKEGGQVYHIEAFRNNALQNRYFIVNHVQVPIQSDKAYASTYGQQQVQQFDIASQQIGDIISSSKKLFADMMKITVSEKEDAKIWKAYDTVDEKSIITITIGLPAAIILTAEAIPLMVMASKSSAFTSATTSIGKAFTINSGKVAAINGTTNFAEQYISTGMAKNMWGLDNLRRIDVLDVGVNAGTGGLGGVFLKSEFDLTYEKGFKSHNFSEFSENLLLNSLKYGAGKSFGSAVGAPLAGYSGSAGEIFNLGGKFTIKTVISTTKKKINKKSE